MQIITNKLPEKLSKKFPSYLGRVGALASAGGGYMVMQAGETIINDYERQQHHTFREKLDIGLTLGLFAVFGYGAGFAGGKVIVKTGELAMKIGVPQAATKMIKKL
jgi:hypothetical protein